MNVEWLEELPRRSNVRSTRYAEFAAELRNNPGQWGKLPRPEYQLSGASAITSNINRDKVKDLPAAEFEARTYKGETWARYMAADAA